MRKMKRAIIWLSVLQFYSQYALAQNPSFYASYATQAEKIYQQMSLDEKIGQLLLPSYVLLANAVSNNGVACKTAINDPTTPKEKIISACGLDQIAKYHLGAVLTGGGPYFNAPTLENWSQLNALATEEHALGSPHDPLLLTGNDAIHGNMHVQGAVIFPHDIGLGVSHDPNLIQNIGNLVGQDSLASGFNWVYMPTLAVAQDLRWGRTYESFGQEPALVKMMGKAYVSGFQDIQNHTLQGPLATAKHFIGDGATQYGLDEGDDAYTGDEASFWKENGQGYEGALQANVGSIMVSYNAIDDKDTGNNTRMHFGGKWDIVNQFKNTGIVGSDSQNYQFEGFMVSDWNAPTRSAYFYNQYHNHLSLPQIMAKSINGGVDMIMLGQGDNSNPFDPHSAPNFTTVGQVADAIKLALYQNLISQARLHDAVIRILQVKLAMAPQSISDYQALQAKERALALTAAEESMVLLKNNHSTLPLQLAQAQKIKNVIFIGDTDDLGLQNGGWTVNWQGQKGNQYFTGADKKSSGATTLEEGIKAKFKQFHIYGVRYFHINSSEQDALPTDINRDNTLVIGLVSEVPYAEFMGDIANPFEPDDWYAMGAANGYNFYLGLPQNQQLALYYSINEGLAISMLKQKFGVPVISVVYSGRPVILSNGNSTISPLLNSDAIIAAFLPGTLGGQALANSVFGDYHFNHNGKSNTLTFPWPANMQQVEDHFQSGALFKIGYGLKD